MAQLMSVTNQEVLVVYVNEARVLDAAMIRDLADQLEQMMNKAEHGKLLINFGRVQFMSSAMIGTLIGLIKKCKAGKVKLKMSNISDGIMEVVKLVRLDKMVDIYPDEEQALAAFSKSSWFS